MNFDIYNISDLTSRAYFEDVLHSYYSKNYRSSILLLYSLVINDLYKKLIYMNENGLFNIYPELEKIKILSQEKEVKYSLIEKEIYGIYKDKNILNKTTVDMLDYLTKVRDKCAHPIFSGEDEYYSPSMDETRMLINKSYNDILIVDLYIKEPYGVIKNSLELTEWNLYTKELFGIKENENEISKFTKYFEKKYLAKMTDNNYIKLFKSLINMIFKKHNEDAIKYQYIRFKLLIVFLDYLSKYGKLELLKNIYNWDLIGNDTIYDSIPKDVDSCQSLGYMFEFLFKYPIFIGEIKDRNELLYNHLKDNLDNNVWHIIKYYSIFYDNIQIAIQDKNESYSFYKIVLKHCSDKMDDKFLIKILKIIFEQIPEFNGYDIADEMCSILIKMVEARKFKSEDIFEILEIMDNNRQIYDISRNNSKEQFKKLVNLGIDLSKFKNIGSD